MKIALCRAVALVALAALSAGCAASVDPLDRRTAPSARAPLPPGVEDPAKIDAPGPVDTSCGDARRSLRPSGSLPSPRKMPAGSTMRRIQDRGRLIVGVDQNTYLFGFRDPATGDIVGFDADIARELARAILGDPEKIEFRAMTSAERIPAIQSDTVDVVVRTMTITCERWRDVAFSTEYYTAGQRVLVASDSTAKGIDDLAGQKVCALGGTTSIRELARRKAKPVAARDWTDCLVLLQQGYVAAVSTDDAILAGLAAQDPSTKVVGDAFTGEPYGIAMSLEARDLTRFVNGVLARMRSDGTWAEIHRRWLAATLGKSSPPQARYRS
ncbi:MAG: glutamate ABC transporter substrate-binding protein [Micromonosporaceae bacterium]